MLLFFVLGVVKVETSSVVQSKWCAGYRDVNLSKLLAGWLTDWLTELRTTSWNSWWCLIRPCFSKLWHNSWKKQSTFNIDKTTTNFAFKYVYPMNTMELWQFFIYSFQKQRLQNNEHLIVSCFQNKHEAILFFPSIVSTTTATKTTPCEFFSQTVFLFTVAINCWFLWTNFWTRKEKAQFTIHVSSIIIKQTTWVWIPIPIPVHKSIFSNQKWAQYHLSSGCHVI